MAENTTGNPTAARLAEQAKQAPEGSFAARLLKGAAEMAQNESGQSEQAAAQAATVQEKPRGVLQRLAALGVKKGQGEAAPVGAMQRGHAEETLATSNDAKDHPAYAVRKNLKYSGS